MKLSEVYKKDRGLCHLCGKVVKRSDASRDHVIPKSWGGTAGRKGERLRLAHKNCNYIRGDMSVQEARDRLAEP